MSPKLGLSSVQGEADALGGLGRNVTLPGTFFLRALVKTCERAVSQPCTSLLCKQLWVLLVYPLLDEGLTAVRNKNCSKTPCLSCCCPATIRLNVKGCVSNPGKPFVIGLLNEGGFEDQCEFARVVSMLPQRRY